ncbi:YbaK/EbsC family protein [Candidatus Sumerlaeota bacterium]|nr:YbaK/EbsC family protein [Candidatus Sumerlaeota bacterium]
MPSRKVKEYLDNAGVKYKVMEHDTAFTAQEVAAATHVKGKELVKAIMVKTGDQMIMAVTPSTRKLDFELLKKILKAKNVILASEEEFAPLFADCEIGAMPPMGKLYNVDVIADESLADDKEIVFRAGTHHDIIRISYEDYKKLENPKLAKITTHI